MDFNCPKCGSGDTQSVQILIESGTSRGTSRGAGMSYSPGTGVGSHTTTTRTTLKTDLANKYTPGARPSQKIGYLIFGSIFALFLLFSLLGGDGQIGGFGFLWLFLSGFFFLMFVTGKKERMKRIAIWEERVEYLSRAWFCHRCGSDWLPSVASGQIKTATFEPLGK